MALPVRIQSASGTSIIATVSATLSATPGVGNLLLVAVSANVGSGSVAITGWNAVGNVSIGLAGSLTLFSKFAGVAESGTITATGTLATLMDLHVYEYSNIDATAPTVSSTSDSGLGVTSRSSGSTPDVVNASSLIFMAVATALGNGGGISWTNSMNAGINTTDLLTADSINFSNASQSAVASWNTSQRAAGMIVTYLQTQGNTYYRGGGR